MRLPADSLARRFSVGRFWLLLRNRLFDEASIVGIGAALALGVNILGLLLGKTAFFNSASRGWSGAWIATIVVAGLLLAGSSLKGMHDGRAEADWILLPASPIEKYSAALADSVIVFPLAAAAIGVAMSAALALVEGLIGGPGNPVWIPGLEALKAWGGYAVAATVFIAGSATFRKSAFLKTGGLAMAFSIAWCLALALLIALCIGIPYGDTFSIHIGSVSVNNGVISTDEGSAISTRALGLMRTVMGIAVYAGIPAFAILFGAAKVVEKEAKDEVQ